MRRFVLAVLAAALVFALTAHASETPDPPAAPKAVVAEPDHTFEPVLEGTSVSHDFVIKNEGAVPLQIHRIKTG